MRTVTTGPRGSASQILGFLACVQFSVFVCAGHAQGQNLFGPPDGDNEYAAIGTVRDPVNLSHATGGDGITLMEEYRGFLFDGGPGTYNGGHIRLTPVIKEVLVQLCVMDDYMADRGTGEGVNPNLVANIDLYAVMKDFSNFYSDRLRGAGIHLYWSMTPFTMPTEPHTYTNGEYCASLYRHTGNITIQKRLPGASQLAVITNAGAWVYNDLRLSEENPQKYAQLFKETGLYRGPQLFIMAHESAHLLGLDDDYTGTGTIMQKFCPLSQIRFSPSELQGIDVKGRRSIAP